MLKVGLINQIARTVIQRTRDIYTEGLQLNEFQPLEWDDFEISGEDHQIVPDGDITLLDRHHLLSWANDFPSEDDDFILSEGDDFLGEGLSDRRHSADNWSVQTARKCAKLSRLRIRSVSVSENYFEVPELQDDSLGDEEEMTPHGA